MAISQAHSFAISTLSTISALLLLGCARSPIEAANSPASEQVTPTVTTSAPPVQASPSPQVVAQNSSEPRSVADQFFKAYVLEKTPWQQLQTYLDPDTYAQLSQLKGYDSDPFTNAQEPAFDYTLGDAQMQGDTAEVEIRFKIGSRQPLPTEFGNPKTVILQNNNGQWQIENIIYSAATDPSGQPNDLLHGWMDNQKALITNQ